MESFYSQFTDDLGAWVIPQAVKRLTKNASLLETSQAAALFTLTGLIMQVNGSAVAYGAMATLLEYLFSSSNPPQEITLDMVKTLLFDTVGKNVEDSTLYKPCSLIIGYVCSISGPPYLELLAEASTIDFLIDSLFQIYDTCKHQSDDTTLCDVYWALSNLALTDVKTTDSANYRTDVVCTKILESQLWKNDIASTDLACVDLKLKREVVQVVVKTLYPFSQDITAYSYQLLALFD